MKYLFYLATPLLLVSGIPQTIQLLQTHSSGDISILTYALTATAIGILLANSIYEKARPLIWANGTSFCMVSLNLFLIILYHV